MTTSTTYLSPEECRAGSGLRILTDPRFLWTVDEEIESLPAPLLAEIEQGLHERIHAFSMTMTMYSYFLDSVDILPIFS